MIMIMMTMMTIMMMMLIDDHNDDGDGWMTMKRMTHDYACPAPLAGTMPSMGDGVDEC